MKSIRIETWFDEHECETCGSSYSQGGEVFVDDKSVLIVEPIAHCFGGIQATEDELLVLALSKLGVEIRIDGEKPHVSNTELSETLL